MLQPPEQLIRYAYYMKEVDHESTAQLLRSVLALGRRLRAARAPGTRALTGLTILGTLYRLGPMLASQLAAEEGLQPQSLTRLLAELDRKQLISRKRSDTDGRAQTITLTALGRRRLLDEIGERRAWLKTAMAAELTPDERDIAKSASAVLLKIAMHQVTDGPSFSTRNPRNRAPALSTRISQERTIETSNSRTPFSPTSTFDPLCLKTSIYRKRRSPT